MDMFFQGIRDLVTANRILAREGILDAFGHVSIRHPTNPDRFLLSRSRSPELVTLDDILEFSLDGAPIDAGGQPLYGERFIHAAVLEARPDVHAVIHSHTPDFIPFGIVNVPLRPVFHVAARMGSVAPVWDIHDRFGDTNLLLTNKDQGRDLAETLGQHQIVLMRGHGCTVAGGTLHRAVLTAIYAALNARLQTQAMQMGEVKFLSPGELEQAGNPSNEPSVGKDRTWEYFRKRAGCDAI